jgi:hypothetical protein
MNVAWIEWLRRLDRPHVRIPSWRSGYRHIEKWTTPNVTEAQELVRQGYAACYAGRLPGRCWITDAGRAYLREGSVSLQASEQTRTLSPLPRTEEEGPRHSDEGCRSK